MEFARIKAKHLIEKHKTNNVFKIARYEGIEVVFTSTSFAFAAKKGENYVIGIPVGEGEKELARMLGHIVLGHFNLYPVETLNGPPKPPNPKMEREAEIFSEELLKRARTSSQTQ